MADVRKGIWSEIAAATIAIDAFRRNLQRLYLEVLGDRLNGRQPVTDDQRPFIRGELRDLDRAIQAVVNTPRVANRETKLHLVDARDQIAKMLDPKFVAPAVAAGGSAARPGLDDAWPTGGDTCWPDYIIRVPGIR